MERPISFMSDGRRLSVMLHLTEVQRQDDAGPGVVIWLNAGIVPRSGPHRLGVELARTLCQAGLDVLRLDGHGLGDSEGDLSAGSLADAYHAIELGEYVPDALEAIAFARRHLAPKDIILAGLCGGAVTAMLAATESAAVSGVVALGLPVLHTPNGALNGDGTAARAWHYLGSYLRSVGQLSRWRKLVHDRQARARLLQMLRALPRAYRSSDGNSNVNWHVVAALERLAAVPTELLLVFGERDPLYSDFKQHFLSADRERRIVQHSAVTLATVSDSDHSFASPELRREMFGVVQRWLHAPGPLSQSSVMVDERRLVGSHPQGGYQQDAA